MAFACVQILRLISALYLGADFGTVSTSKTALRARFAACDLALTSRPGSRNELPSSVNKRWGLGKKVSIPGRTLLLKKISSSLLSLSSFSSCGDLMTCVKDVGPVLSLSLISRRFNGLRRLTASIWRDVKRKRRDQHTQTMHSQVRVTSSTEGSQGQGREEHRDQLTERTVVLFVRTSSSSRHVCCRGSPGIRRCSRHIRCCVTCKPTPDGVMKQRTAAVCPLSPLLLPMLAVCMGSCAAEGGMAQRPDRQHNTKSPTCSQLWRSTRVVALVVPLTKWRVHSRRPEACKVTGQGPSQWRTAWQSRCAPRGQEWESIRCLSHESR